MHREEFRRLLRTRPFRPFRLFTTDGTAIPVWHPEFAFLSPDGRTLHLYQQDYTYDMLDIALLPRFAFDPLPDTVDTELPGGPPATPA
jgi:hypothetical protein